ncbi:MAG: GHMP kinase [Vulcanimicrobiaceae bacterium]
MHVEEPRSEQALPAAHKIVIRSRAPLRISFCGGGTDVPPYPEQFGGCVLSCTIDKYAYVSLRPRSDDSIHVRSLDANVDIAYQPHANGAADGKLDLATAIFRRFGASGLDVFMHSDAQPGSGLGSSSAMIAALSGGLARWKNIHYSPYELAGLACAIERDDLQIVGGYQDQYAAVFGGFNFIEFSGAGVEVTPLRLPYETIDELHYHLLLCDTGKTRLSSNILKEQTANVVQRTGDTLQSLHTLKAMTVAMKAALLRGKLMDFGDLLHNAWLAKRKLASSISNGQIDELYSAGRAAGATGGKILGAGGGGYLLFFVPFTRRERVARALTAAGCGVTSFAFFQGGTRTWAASPDTWVDATPTA